ncbi:MAG: HIT family protein [Cyclobacteriaceae bacterium]
MLSETLKKFGHPNSLIKEYEHWYLLLRPDQVTLGSMVIISKSDSTSFSDLSSEAYADLKYVTTDIEVKLRKYLDFEKINYKMLMMVDPEVHFHVFPRYSKVIKFMDRGLSDPQYPGLADITKPKEFDEEEIEELLKNLKDSIK